MKTTRRRLLGLISLGAAAAALVQTPTEAAATEACHQCQPESLYPHVYGHANGLGFVGGLTVSGDVTVSTPYSSTLTHCGHIAAECCDACWGTGEATMSATRSYANGRADGYNRGREVEMARQEARHNDPYSLHMPVVG